MRIIRIFVLNLSACAFFMGACTTPPRNRERAELQLSTGTAYMAQGDYSTALTYLLEAEKQDPQNPAIQNNLALVYFAKERFDLAEESITKALSLNPNYSEGRNNYARILIERGRYDSAIQELKRVVQDLTYKPVEKAYYHMALAYFRKNEFKNAEIQLLQAFKTNRDFCPAQILYGRTLYEEKEYSKASESLDASFEVCQEVFDEGQYYNALSQYRLGRKDKAIARLEELLKFYPRSKYVSEARSLLKIIR